MTGRELKAIQTYDRIMRNVRHIAGSLLIGGQRMFIPACFRFEPAAC